jgi:PAS domain-containing protein
MRRSDPIEDVAVRGLFKEFFRRADVGFAVFDRKLRYRALNPRLASMNGIPVGSHIGKTVHDVLGNLSHQIEPALLSVFNSGDPVHLEVVGSLPGQTRLGRWTVNYFGIRDCQETSLHVGAVVIEVAKDISLQNLTIEPSRALRSWKEIAQYFGTCVKTVQRWERMYEFPVRRLQASKGAAVFAIRSEVERWQAEATVKNLRKSSKGGRRKF